MKTTEPQAEIEQPLVSVLLPVYNGAAFIGDTIESALRQTYRNIEVIVVDDGSTDGTVAAIEARAAGDSRVRVIRQPNRGVAHARNRALAEARGEFVAPIDADDLWSPVKIEQQVRRMAEAGSKAGLVYCWWVWIDGDGTVLDRSPRWCVEGDGFAMMLQVNYTGNASVPLYRRRALKQICGYDEELGAHEAGGCEDWDVALKVAELYSVAVVPEILVGYRRRRQSMSTASDMMWRSQRLVIEGVLHRNPTLAPILFQRSADQFALYLAGISFWSGSYLRALRWGLRARKSGLATKVVPYVLRLLLRCLRGRLRAGAVVMRPNECLDASRIPEPLIPYDRIYREFAPPAARTEVTAVRKLDPT